MKMLYVRPSPVLTRLIDHYFIYDLDPDKMVSEYPSGMHCLPCTYCRMGFFFSEPTISRLQDGTGIPNPEMGVSGFYSQPRIYQSTGRVSMIIVGFTPIGLQQVIDLPVSELSNKNVSLQDVFTSGVDELQAGLHAASGWGQRIQVIESFLIRQLRRKLPEQQIDRIINHVIDSSGKKPVSTLASDLSMSERTLHRKISTHMGIGPKLFSKIVRFQAALHQMTTHPAVRFSELTYAMGYFDQAHFIHEFTALYGDCPKAYLRQKRSVLGHFYDQNQSPDSPQTLAYV